MRATPRAWVAAVLLAAFVLLLVAVVTHWAPVQHLDDQVHTSLARYGSRHPAWVRWWSDLTTVLQPNVWRVIAAAVVVALVWRGRRDAALALAAVVVVAGLAEGMLKLAVGRTRPVPFPGAPHALGASFPSGHALTAAAVVVALLVALVHRGHWMLWAGVGVIVLAVAFSRLALGVHYLSDVIGGLLFGLACALGVPWLVGQPRPT